MRQQLLYEWALLIVFSLLAYFIQTHLYLHKDVAIITHTAAALLAGETYAKNIFEPNPPMIFYLSMPAIVIAKFISIPVLSAMRIYVITLAAISIACSVFMIKKLFSHNIFLIYLLAYVMGYVLLFLPAQHFAQREHFLLILILPYLFLTALRLEKKQINGFFAAGIGLAAGIGFAIKPHFLSAFLLIELYVMLQKRNLLSWVRVETLCILGVFAAYITAIFLFYPAYLHDVLPLWMTYYAAITHPFSEILFYPALLYCFAVIIFYFMTRHLNECKIICQLFLMALIGFIFSYLAPRVAWYYHILPALGIACLLAALILGQIAPSMIKKSQTKYKTFSLTAMISIVYLVPFAISINLFIIAAYYFNSETDLSRLTQFFAKQKRPTTFFLLAMTHDSTVVEFYAPTHYVGNFPILIWEYNQLILHHFPSEKAYRYESNVPHLIDNISQELNEKKPEFVIVNVPSSIHYLGTEVNYIKKYSRYKSFQTAWLAYHYLQRIGEYTIYERI